MENLGCLPDPLWSVHEQREDPGQGRAWVPFLLLSHWGVSPPLAGERGVKEEMPQKNLRGLPTLYSWNSLQSLPH